jgi:hypothetical protein
MQSLRLSSGVIIPTPPIHRNYHENNQEAIPLPVGTSLPPSCTGTHWLLFSFSISNLLPFSFSLSYLLHAVFLLLSFLFAAVFLVILEHSGFNMHGKSNLRASLKEKQNLCVS